MMIEDRFFDQQWVQEMSNEDFRMLMYLMHFASKKCGIVELNMRMLNFAANTGRMYTQDDVLERFSGMLRLIPGKKATAIFPNWIATNWAKNGRPIDTGKNPLFKSVVQELASYGMTIDDLNSMAKSKIMLKETKEECNDVRIDASDNCDMPVNSAGRRGRRLNLDAMFDEFWRAYPGPRKVDKKKCRVKFDAALARSPDGERSEFNRMMAGLSKWKQCSTWNKDGGQFIRAPLVWLNNENWNDAPDVSDAADQAAAQSKELVMAEQDKIVSELKRKGLM